MQSRLLALCCLFSTSALAQEKVTFNEHIRPILSDNCFACHGIDAEHRKGKRRLDTAAGATADRMDDVEADRFFQHVVVLRYDPLLPDAPATLK